MNDQDKTREQLINELVEMRQRVAELEAADTERRQMEENQRKALVAKERALAKALRATHALWEVENDLHLFKTIVESSQEAIAISDPDGRFVYVNPAHEKLFGYSLEEARQKNYRDCYPPESVEVLDRVVAPALARGESWEGVLDVLDARGRRLPLWERADTVRDAEGKMLFGFGLMHDISEQVCVEGALRKAHDELETRVQERTAEFTKANQALQAEIAKRKQTEKVLRESEERFRSIFENATIGLYRTTPDGQILMANPTLVHMLGYASFEELVQRNLEEGGFEPGYPRAAFKQRVESEGQVIGLESAWVRRDGATLFLRESARAVHDEAGNTAYYEGTVEDLTERKQAGDALRESEQRLALAVDGSNGGQWHYELNPDDPSYTLSDDAYFSPRLKSFIGYEDDEFPNSLAAWESRIVPEDLEVLLEKSRAHRAGQTDSYEMEYRIRHKEGSIRWIYSRGRVQQDEHGRPIRFAGIDWDITERKLAEEALRHRAEELATLQATVLQITTPHDLPTLLQTIVERAARLLDAPSGGLYLCDPDRKEARCVVSYNTPSDYTGTVLKYGEGAAGTVAQTGKPLIIDDYRTWDRRAAVYDEERPFTAVLSAPMTWQGQVTGVIHVLHNVEGQRFTQSDLELLTLFANHAAIAVENARLYEKALQDAKTKATLLDEVNHRVKNTLTAIIGLLHIEQSYAEMADHATYEAIIQNLTNRVSGLATVHGLLAASEWAPLLLSDLAGQIIKSATQMCPRDKQVFIDTPSSPVRVTPDQAHNLALVINELATNTIQHTLLGRSTGHISVRIALEDGFILFEYRDDGPGYPEDVLQLERHAVGFDLIKNLTRQSLRGELSLYNDEGAVAAIRFPTQT